ncbi:hypothetical protein B0H14DRAFT_3706579 [Mycena olivaceomarginata]|nr:hypothetical protein B0H14DRAFT_3706579 [Mycena olivaceomarginata]
MPDRMLFNQAEMETCILGAWDLGACLSLFLEGVLCAQFAHYLSLNKRDSMWMKTFCGSLVLLTTLEELCNPYVTLFGRSGSGIQHRAQALGLAISRNAYLVIICITVFLFAPVSGLIVPFHKYLGVDHPLGWSRAVRRLAFETGSTICQIDLCAQQHSHQCALARGPVANILTPLASVDTAGK